MPKLSEMIAEGKEIHLSNGKGKDLVVRKTKNGWISHKSAAGKGGKRQDVLKEDTMIYIKRLYSYQYKIVSPSDVELDWQPAVRAKGKKN
jgi:hypothetical protein